jgi:hypothetical protein
MLAAMFIDEPIEKVVDDWNLFEDKVVKKFGTFRTVDQNIIGVRRRVIGLETIDLKKGKMESIELGPSGIVAQRREALNMHITFSGTPHRGRHSFGYWHINPMDELYFSIPPKPGEELGYFIVLMQTPRGDETESFAWYCNECLTLIRESRYPSGKLGLDGFWRAEVDAVRTYNSDAKNRTCPECGNVNPFAYCWNTAKDTPEEAAARQIW